jgi:hypothetical protein
MKWNRYFQDKKNVVILFLTLLFLSVVLFSFLNFLTFNEYRTGSVFNDPVLKLIGPVELSSIIFLITYSFSIAGIIFFMRKPASFILLLQVYTLMTVIRMVCLYSFPLEAPAGVIPLKDVFLHGTFYSGRENLKDLFFSGHTATLFLFAFLSSGSIRVLFVAAAAAVGIMLMWQHVHYSIDVIAAPLMVYITCILVKRTNGLIARKT